MSNTATGRKKVMIDGNSAAAHVAYATNEVIVIYPITPSSPMGEEADDFAARGRKNLWGTVPSVTEMQSEAGAAGSVHGALTSGALTTTFTASQGLLLMIPNMFKIAGELTPTVFHVAARALATQGLSIFGDHSDVMAARSTGWAQLCSSNVQEVMDFALIAQAATLESRVPFIHFFDGFRTSHEIQKVEMLTEADMRAMLDQDALDAHRARGLNPNRPVIRGTAQNPDVFFQSRESANPYYLATPGKVQQIMDRFARLVGRQYHLFDYHGAPDAERVVVVMGSGVGPLLETTDALNAAGEKVGIVNVRLFRPFDAAAMVAALPPTVRKIAVLDRVKEPGSAGEPLYQDVQTAIMEAVGDGRLEAASMPRVVGGRYGLGSKEFTPGMAKAVFDNLASASPKNHFTVGIHDDLTHSSLDWDEHYNPRADAPVHTAMFYGLGSDGTVGANKNSIKIIGSATDNYAQGYFVYDSKKSGSMTISHLRFSPEPIRSTYLIDRAGFLAVHAFPFLSRFEILDHLEDGGTLLLNSPYPADKVWAELPREVQEKIIAKQAKVWTIDAYSLAASIGLGGRINVIMQTAFFCISGILPQDEALEMIKDAIEKTYASKGRAVVDMNIRAAQFTAERLAQVAIPETADSVRTMIPPVPANAPDFVRHVTAEMIAMRGDSLPVSAMPADGTFPVGTAQYEKRNIAREIPIWDPETCIQCNQCAFVCPHATIRVKLYPETYANGSSPESWKSAIPKGKDMEGLRYTVQVAPEDCTGCGACVHICPAFAKDANGNRTNRRAINMMPQEPNREAEAANWDYFLSIPETDTRHYSLFTMKGSQFARPLMEFSGACAGCGETPYIKLLTQLFGDRALIANATGCSSIYGGNLPTTPYTTNQFGRGPAWSNSLFEDAAEFGLGMRLTVDKMEEHARELLAEVDDPELVPLTAAALAADCDTPEAIEAQRERLAELEALLKKRDNYQARRILSILDYLVPRSTWIIGGDGWAYDIGYGGLDHVLASGRNVNILVLDTGVYSNTGGQSSKATPRGAVAKFAAAGKDTPKKDLGAIAMSSGTVYVAQIAYGASMPQTVKAFQEAESYRGPSLIIAYSHCIAHGIDMTTATDLHKDAVATGFWPLYRYDPRRAEQGANPFQLDSKPPTGDVGEFLYKQNRFRILKKADPQRAEHLLIAARNDVQKRTEFYQNLLK